MWNPFMLSSFEMNSCFFLLCRFTLLCCCCCCWEINGELLFIYVQCAVLNRACMNWPMVKIIATLRFVWHCLKAIPQQVCNQKLVMSLSVSLCTSRLKSQELDFPHINIHTHTKTTPNTSKWTEIFWVYPPATVDVTHMHKRRTVKKHKWHNSRYHFRLNSWHKITAFHWIIPNSNQR